MSLLRLTAKINADASQFHATAKGVEQRASMMTRTMGSQLKSAFLYFAGFSGLSRMIRTMDDLIENVDDLRPRMRELGIEVDDALIENAKKARAEWEQLTMSLKVGLIPTFTFMLRQTTELYYAFQAMAKVGMATNIWSWFTKSPGEMVAELRKIQEELKGNLDRMGLAQPKPADVKATKVAAEKGVSEATPKLMQESLSKIGGFTGRAQEELKSIQFQQLRAMEKVATNTEPLKRGIL